MFHDNVDKPVPDCQTLLDFNGARDQGCTQGGGHGVWAVFQITSKWAYLRPQKVPQCVEILGQGRKKTHRIPEAMPRIQIVGMTAATQKW